MNKKKGISLIVLVITILVMIILAGVVIVSLQKDNPVEKAKEAKGLSSIAAVREAVTQYAVTKQAGVEKTMTAADWEKDGVTPLTASGVTAGTNYKGYTHKLKVDTATPENNAAISKLLGVDVGSIGSYGTLYVNPETGSNVFELNENTKFTLGNGIIGNGEFTK